MTFATLAIMAAVVVILLLLGMVVALQRRLGRLTMEVRTLKALSESTADLLTTASAEPVSAPSRAVQADGTGPVAVITGLRPEGEHGPPGEITTGRVVSVTLAGPMIKVAALSHGLRRALDDENRLRIAYAFRKELRRQRKMRRKAAARRSRRNVGVRP